MTQRFELQPALLIFFLQTLLFAMWGGSMVPRLPIPDICHFFTRAKFLENKIYTEKRQFFALNL